MYYLIILYTSPIKGEGIINSRINRFIPNEIAVVHDSLIEKYIGKGECIMLRKSDLIFPLLTTEGFLKKVRG